MAFFTASAAECGAGEDISVPVTSSFTSSAIPPKFIVITGTDAECASSIERGQFSKQSEGAIKAVAPYITSARAFPVRKPVKIILGIFSKISSSGPLPAALKVYSGKSFAVSAKSSMPFSRENRPA